MQMIFCNLCPFIELFVYLMHALPFIMCIIVM